MALAAPAHAQVEEIIVTAERRSESLQDVPISLSAFSEQSLEKLNLNELEDFDASVPNVSITDYFGQATTFRAFIRGIGAATVEVTQDPAVALYVDGVYVGSSSGGSFEASDLERVEVLRGPQGTLYGRNATGGAINLISKKPKLGEWGFGQSVTLGNFDKFQSATNINIPIGDRLALRASGVISKRDGTVENLGPGKDFGAENRLVGRLALRYEPTDTLTFDVAADYSEIKDTTRYQQVIEGPAAAVAGTGNPLIIPLGPVIANVYYPDPVSSKRLNKAMPFFPVEADNNKIFGTSLTATWDVTDRLQIKSITAYRDVNADWFAMTGGSAYNELEVPGAGIVGTFPTLSTGRAYNKFNQFTQELQFLGDIDTSIGNFEYVTGLFYYRDEADSGTSAATLTSFPLTSYTLTKNRSFAIYNQTTYRPAGTGLELTLGLRYTWDSRQALRFDPNATPVIDGLSYDRDFKKFNPSFTAAYKFSDDLNIYAKVVTGYRAGGTSIYSQDPALFQRGAEPETITAYEGGFKSQFFDRRVRLNAAAFIMDYKNYQASVQTGATPAVRDIISIGDGKIKGFEADLQAAVTDELTFNASVGYLHTRFDNRSIDPGGGAPIVLVTREFPFAPKFSYTLGLDYTRVLANDWELGAYVNFSHQDQSISSALAVRSSATNSSKSLLDAGISIGKIPLGGGDLKVRIWGKNLTNQDYYDAAYASATFAGATVVSAFGDPRTYGITLSYNYN
ncbi:hypothetical protein MB02_14030 [Croceicoccus estronivorus]|nr:hypothetical protein MB02_14030 [Croceicoccus estronivorus]